MAVFDIQLFSVLLCIGCLSKSVAFDHAVLCCVYLGIAVLCSLVVVVYDSVL